MMASVQWLTILTYALPNLLAVGIGIFLLATRARPGPGRRLGLIGMGLLLLAALAGLALSVVQTVWIVGAQTSQAGAMAGTIAMFNALRVVLNVLTAGGLLTLVWGLCRATQNSNAR
jgi:hypothetical protein